MFKKWMIGMGLVVILFFSGCHSTKALQVSNQNILKGRKLAIANKDNMHYPKLTSLSQTSVISPALTILYNLTDAMKEDKYVSSGYMYPTGIISEKTSSLLINKYKMIKTNNLNKSDYTLEVETDWHLIKAPFSFNKLFVLMSNRIILKETTSHKVIADKYCIYGPDYVKNIPKFTSEEFMANNARLIKSETSRIINICMDELKTEVFR